MERLFVYGTLQPGKSNAHILENIGGTFLPGHVTGTYHNSGWGAAMGFPGLVLSSQGEKVPGVIFSSDALTDHWAMLDEFEDGYDRVEVDVVTDNGIIRAWVYQLQPE
jgi:gamma-glutamylcyclotransferase (GGCT)/AIG2-like uncharacterized protein YtfP